MKQIVFLVVLIAFFHEIEAKQITSNDSTILLNQIGYLPDAIKIALIKGNFDKFSIVESESGKTIFTGNADKPMYWEFSGDTVRCADFSSVTKPGKYMISIPGSEISSSEFAINKDVYNDLTKASVTAFYFNRCSYTISKEFGGKWARPAGHPDTAVIIHESAASGKRIAGTTVSSPGGWYDAGDYNKYIVNCGITMYTLLLFYQMHPEYCNSLNLNIPESKNDLPDLLDEILFNLKWMLTMQDPYDGGVYHKLTNKGFDGFIMPDKAVQPRYLVGKTTAAALDFASVMAMASRLFAKSKHEQLTSLSKTCLNAANKAMKWAEANPAVYYKQPNDVHTGTYGDTVLKDEFFWANVELALANKERPLPSLKDVEVQTMFTPSWARVEALGIISLALSNDTKFETLKKAASQKLLMYVDTLLSIYQSSAFKVSLNLFRWGSNADHINRTLLEIIAYELTGNKKYLPVIQGDADYILGKNATGYCFVTGFGSRSPMHIHHRPSGGDGIVDPVPGFLVGGPNPDGRNDCGEKAYSSKLPAKSYVDAECSYATNEIAINWNAPLFFVIGTLEAINQKK